MNQLFKSIITSPIEVWEIILLLCISLLLGLLFSITYLFVKNKSFVTKDFPITLTIFPFISCAIMLLVFSLSSITTTERAAVALAGVFCMTKFRSKQHSTEDLCYIFFSTAIGLSLGMGFIGYAVLVELLLLILLIVFKYIQFPFISKRKVLLKIMVPEDLNYDCCFNDVFKKYALNANLFQVKTSDMGSLFVLKYNVTLKKGVNTKEFLDSLRIINGNLDVQIMINKYTNEN